MKPLTGIRILTIEQYAAAPYGSMFLADLGAEVIKIENAQSGGDAARSGGPYLLGEHDSLYFQGWNTNKKSITLDLKSKAGKAAVHELVLGADALMNNLRGDQASQLGLDYKSLSAINPRIVCAHISAYGRDNERASRPGYDYLMQAEAGLMSLTGDPHGDPCRSGTSTVDFMSGLVLSLGLLSCLIKARETGVGCDVETSLFDVALHQLSYAATWYLNEGHIAHRLPRGSHLSATPVQTFKAADGWIFVMCMSDRFWTLLVEELGLRELFVDPHFATMAARSANRSALTEVLDAVFASQTMAHWEHRLGSIVPIAPVYDIDRALENPFVRCIGMISHVPHPQMPHMRLLANPLKIDGQRPSQTGCASLGANNEQFLRVAEDHENHTPATAGCTS
jgi:crotonobetainyl-CoA:carnitine CoA-transferase CaiB-like acyl-CoA transferase